MGKIFISYARNDYDKAMDLYGYLSKHGFSLWLDRKDLLPGQEWKSEIKKAIRESVVFLACLSNNSVSKQGYVQVELREALDVAQEMPEGVIYIIPVRLDECEVPNRLAMYQWVDYSEIDEKEKLIRAIQSRIKPAEIIQNEPERLFMAGDKVRIVRNELGITTSEFIEALEFPSQREYEKMENQERELPLSLLKKMSGLTGVNLEWLKHGYGHRYTIEAISLNPVEAGLEFCASLNPHEYFFTLDKKELHAGIVIQTGKYRFQVLETGITLDFWNWVESYWAITRFYHFLKELSDSWHHDIESIIIPTRFDKQLFDGDIHFLSAIRNSDGPFPGFLHDLLDINHDRLSRRPRSKVYDISSFDKIQEYFRNYLQEEKNVRKSTETAKVTPASTDSLKEALTHALRGTYDAARKRGYVAASFLQMLEEHGGMETAKRLLSKSEPQTGLFELWELGLLHESMEAVVLQDRFKGLFTEDEVGEAYRRLDELGYFKKG
jgi:hypothetical protein